jgi:hypothetical protein
MSAYRLVGPVVAMLLMAGTSARAAAPGPTDPYWPCQQIKVPRLSLAAIWSGPAPEQQAGDWRTDRAVTDLVREIAQRRIPIEQAQTAIHDFARETPDRQPKLLELLTGLFSVLDDERAEVIAGLDRFGARQRELAANLRDDNAKLSALRADPSSDAGETIQMTQKVTWGAEVYQDRRQSLSFACEVPGRIEQRLFALARAIQSELP